MSQTDFAAGLYLPPARTGALRGLVRLLAGLAARSGPVAADDERHYLDRASDHLLADVGLRRGGQDRFRPY